MHFRSQLGEYRIAERSQLSLVGTRLFQARFGRIIVRPTAWIVTMTMTRTRRWHNWRKKGRGRIGPAAAELGLEVVACRPGGLKPGPLVQHRRVLRMVKVVLQPSPAGQCRFQHPPIVLS
jgi:hypothetical protein